MSTDRRSFLLTILAAPFLAAWRRMFPVPITPPTTPYVGHYGASFSISAEALKNDDLAIFANISQRMADAANRNIERYMWCAIRESSPSHPGYRSYGHRRYARMMTRRAA